MIRFNGITIDRGLRTISYRGRTHQFKGPLTRNIKFDIACALLLDAGVSKEMMFWNLFGDDPEGGPDSGESTIQVAMNHLAQDFVRLRIEIRSWRIAGVTFYCAVPMFEIGDPKPGWQNAKYIKRQNGPSRSVANVVG
jgi:hypothetical protein